MKKIFMALVCCTFFANSFPMDLREVVKDPKDLTAIEKIADGFTEEALYWDRMYIYGELFGRNSKGNLATTLNHYHDRDASKKKWETEQTDKLAKFLLNVPMTHLSEDALNIYPECADTVNEIEDLRKKSLKMG